MLVIHGTEDNCQPVERGRAVAEVTGGRLVEVEGAGHVPHGRHPVLVNTLIKEFVDMHAPSTASTSPAPTPWLFARERKRRALWVCSPIGLGHVLRDLAIARALRERVPDLEIEWLAQSPVTEVLTSHGEIVHPASVELASESAHWESESTHHDLHAFYAFRRMDEILCANYMLFDDVVRETTYDLWVGDESWEVDHFLHENPERKIAPYAFLTDVVGFLPVDPGHDAREVELCADYNAEMVEHRERFPYVRDRSVFIGGYDELPDASLGAGLPTVRDYTRRWFTSVPYVVPFDPGAYRRPARLRRQLGYGTDYPLYLAAVGGTAVGRDLLELTAEAFALVRKEEPDARMVMVTGPRLDPGLLPDVEGMEKRGYVDSLFEHLACADLSVVQGGLSTTMELTAARRPFVYFPLAHHWEQQHFVAHRLDHYGAGIRMDYDVHDAARAGRGDDGGALGPSHLSAGAPRWRRQGGGAAGERAHRLTPALSGERHSSRSSALPVAADPGLHGVGRRVGPGQGVAGGLGDRARARAPPHVAGRRRVPASRRTRVAAATAAASPGRPRARRPARGGSPGRPSVYDGSLPTPCRDLVEQVGEPLHRTDPVDGPGAPGLGRVDDPARQVADVDHLDRVVGRAGREHLAAVACVAQPERPVGEPAARVARADDQAGPDRPSRSRRRRAPPARRRPSSARRPPCSPGGRRPP